MRTVLRTSFRIFLGVAVLLACFLLGTRILFVLQPDVFHPDAQFYFTMGRAVLNGFTPYLDSFESKPPGIFFLSALSLALTDTPVVGTILTAVYLLMLPLLFAWVIGRSPERKMAAFLLGSIIALWTSMQAGVWQVESFGNMFAVLYVLLLFTWGEGHSWKRILLAAACLLGSIGFKEPFILATCAVALVMSTKPKDMVHRFLIPVAIALITGAVIMLVLGWLKPYLTIYLPAIVGVRIVGYGEPLWVRGFMIWQLWQPLSSTSVLLPWAMVVAVACYAWESRHSAWRLSALFLGLYLSTIAVQLGGTVSTLHYSSLFLPIIAAIGVRILDGSRSNNLLIFAQSLIAVSIMCTINWPRLSPPPDPVQLQMVQDLRVVAARLDGLLKACEIDRYMYAPNPPQPLLPAYTYASTLTHYPYREIDHVQFGVPFMRITLEHLSAARILIVNPEGFKPKNDLGMIFQRYIQLAFTNEAPPCAKEFLPLTGYGVLFRKIDTPITLKERAAEGEQMWDFQF